MSDLEQSRLIYSFPFPQISQSSSTLRFSTFPLQQTQIQVIETESKHIMESSMMSSTTDFHFKPNRSFYLTLTQSMFKKEESEEYMEQMFSMPMTKEKVVFRNACWSAEDLILKLGICE